jgi:uncharacterized membrane protein
MSRLFIAYAATVVVFVALDILWLRLIAVDWYQRGIGHLLAPEVNVAAGVVFYLVYPIGVLLFAVLPVGEAGGWLKAAGWGSLFGLFTYLTYDLSNLATLRNWPLGLTVLDIAWGALLSSAAAVSGKLASDVVA